HTIARAMPGEKFFRQLAHDRPLRWARVLRLIDQDVVDTAVELVLNPWPHVRAGKQVHSALNEIVEVQKSSRSLSPLILTDHGISDDSSGGPDFDLPQGGELVASIPQACCCFLVPL